MHTPLIYAKTNIFRLSLSLFHVHRKLTEKREVWTISKQMTIQDPCGKHEVLVSYKWPDNWNDDDNRRERYSKTKQINIWDLSNPHSSHCNALQTIPTQKILSICDSNWRTINGKPAPCPAHGNPSWKENQNRGQVKVGGLRWISRIDNQDLQHQPHSTHTHICKKHVISQNFI